VSLDPDHIHDLFAAFGPVEVRRMFGGAGLYADGVMFGLVSGSLIHLKADATTMRRFQSEGCVPFKYGTKTGRRAVMSYWRLPDRLYDDPETLAQGARQALDVARGAGKRTSTKKAARRKGRSKR
jgi:DNA transformation protein